MAEIQETSTNRVLVVDDDVMLIQEYVRCLGEGYEPDSATTTLSDLEKVLFGEDTTESGAARFLVETRDQGGTAVDAGAHGLPRRAARHAHSARGAARRAFRVGTQAR